MFFVTDREVFIMAMLRVFSGCVELAAAFLMLKFGQVAAALRWNTLPTMVGPIVLITVTLIGLSGLAGKVNIYRLAMIVAGIGLVFIGTRNLTS